MKHSIVASYKNVRIRQLEPGDLELLRIWRSNEENSRYLSSTMHITPEMQVAWYETYLKDTDHYIFAIEETVELKRFVGCVSLYNFRDTVCECGKFLVGDEAVRGKGVGRAGISLAMLAGFVKFELQEIDAAVLVDNIPALITDQKAGFQIVGERQYADGRMENTLLATKEHFFTVNSHLAEVEIHGSRYA